MTPLLHLDSIEAYCRTINIAEPRYPFFDIRRFEDNMRTVHAKQAPLRHEFYAIALRHAGHNTEVNGSPLSNNLFFNSPYQIISWDIAPDWQGWYIMFGHEFLSMNSIWGNFLVDYPFFRLDAIAPMDLPPQDTALADTIFQHIYEEYHGRHADNMALIQAYTQLLLQLTKRYFQQSTAAANLITLRNNHQHRTADVVLVSRFQALIEQYFDPTIDHSIAHTANTDARNTTHYAEQLHVHPNHLNAVVKRVTRHTASAIIHRHIIMTAQFLLKQTLFSTKEIAYRLYFREPTHFSAFFKKYTGTTPQSFREKHLIA